MLPAVTASAPMATAIITAAIAALSTPQGEILATAEPHQATRLDAELSMTALKEYREEVSGLAGCRSFTLN